MRSQTSRTFWRLFDDLPETIRERAKIAYGLWRQNPAHPSLHFKRVGQDRPLYSVRIGKHYRALVLLDGDTIVWFWIGSHDDYDSMLGS